MHHPVLSKSANYLFAVPVALLTFGLLSLPDASPGASAFHHTLLAVLACLGACLTVLYGRMRLLFMVLGAYLGFLILQAQSAAFIQSRQFGPHAGLIFNSTCLILPLVFAINGWSRERGQPLAELARRTLYHGMLIGGYALVASWWPTAIAGVIARTWMPWLPTGWSVLPQLPTLVLCASVLALVIQAVWRPRAEHTAMALSGLCLALMLPRVYLDANTVPVLSAAIMLLLVVSLIQETFLMTFRDELTGLRGRRALNECLARLDGNYAIAMVDVDHFKKFNDTYGHETGDQVLRLVAGRLAKVGGGGRAYRYGGEEFALVFFNKLSSDCQLDVEAVRVSIESARMRLRDASTRPSSDSQGKAKRGSAGQRAEVRITASIGVADSRTVTGGPQAVIEAADAALYAAKGAGRNCVRVARRAAA